MRPVLILAFALAAGTATAGSLINKDSTSYDVAINCGGGTAKMSISGGTTKSGALRSSASSCTVEVDGVGEVEASGSDDVIIKDGKLSVD